MGLGGGRWCASYLAFILPLTPDDVLVPATGCCVGATPESRRELVWIQTAQRLTWHNGETEALRRLNAGAV